MRNLFYTALVATMIFSCTKEGTEVEATPVAQEKTVDPSAAKLDGFSIDKFQQRNLDLLGLPESFDFQGRTYHIVDAKSLDEVHFLAPSDDLRYPWRFKVHYADEKITIEGGEPYVSYLKTEYTFLAFAKASGYNLYPIGDKINFDPNGTFIGYRELLDIIRELDAKGSVSKEVCHASLLELLADAGELIILSSLEKPNDPVSLDDAEGLVEAISTHHDELYEKCLADDGIDPSTLPVERSCDCVYSEQSWRDFVAPKAPVVHQRVAFGLGTNNGPMVELSVEMIAKHSTTEEEVYIFHNDVNGNDYFFAIDRHAEVYGVDFERGTGETNILYDDELSFDDLIHDLLFAN